MMNDYSVLIGVPSHDRRIDYGIFPAALAAGVPHRITFCAKSVLTANFNALLCEAMNEEGCTHFLLWHSDIVPTGEGWLMRMLEIMCEWGLDVLSAVVPIKEDSGRTSTALQKTTGDVQCLFADDLKTLPATFGTADLRERWGDVTLLINSGLLLIRLKNLDPKKCHFTMLDKMERGGDGRWEVGSLSEDWVFSNRIRQAGLSYAATQEIKVIHYGTKGWAS